MKKLLLATSILAATTGYAAAEISLTGDARMGVVYDGEDVQFSERARVRFNMSGQTDTGLEFGASFRADQANTSADGGSFGNSGTNKRGTVWISGAFGKLEMGDINSAAEEAFGDLSVIGFSDLGSFTDVPYINGDGGPNLEQGPGALYSYTMGGFEFHLGMSDGSSSNTSGLGGDTNGFIGVEEGDDRDTTYSVALAYAGDTYKVGVGYLDNGDVDTGDQGYGGSEIIIFGETEIGGFGLKGYYADFDDYISDLDVPGAFTSELEKSYGLTVDYTINSTTLTGFARRDETSSDFGELDGDYDTFGIGAAYDLGGGASVRGGVVNTDRLIEVSGTDYDKGETIADIGLKLNF